MCKIVLYCVVLIVGRAYGRGVSNQHSVIMLLLPRILEE